MAEIGTVAGLVLAIYLLARFGKRHAAAPSKRSRVWHLRDRYGKHLNK